MVNHNTKTTEMIIDCTFAMMVNSTIRPNFYSLALVKTHDEKLSEDQLKSINKKTKSFTYNKSFYLEDEDANKQEINFS